MRNDNLNKHLFAHTNLINQELIKYACYLHHNKRVSNLHFVWVDCSNQLWRDLRENDRKITTFSDQAALRSWQAYLRSVFIATFPLIFFDKKEKTSLYIKNIVGRIGNSF